MHALLLAFLMIINPGGGSGSGLAAINISGGTTSSNVSAVTFGDAGGVSFGFDGSVITANVTAAPSPVNFSAGAASGDLGSVVFSNSNGVSFGLNGSTITATVKTAYVGLNTAQTNVTWTVNSSGISLNAAGYAGVGETVGTIAGTDLALTVNTDGVSIQYPKWLTTAMASNRGSDFVAATAAFNGTNASGTIASNAISVSVAAQSNQSAIKGFGISNTGNTLGNTGVSSGIDWVLAASGGVTASESTAVGGPNTAWISVAAPAPIATAVKAVASVGSTGTITRYAPEDHQHAGVAAFAVSNTGNTAGNTRSQVGTLYLAASGAITASQSTAAAGNDTVWFSVAAQSNQSAIKAFGATNTGNTAGNTGVSTGVDWVIAGTNNITISESTAAGGPNTLWLSAPNVAAGNITVSAGTSTAALGSLVFSDSNNVSFGLNGSTITASASGGGGGGAQVGISTQGNTAGTTGFASVSYQLVGSGAITLSQSTSNNGAYTLTVTVPQTSSIVGTSGLSVSTNGSTISVQPQPLSEFHPFRLDNGLLTNSTFGQSSLYFVPVDIPWPIVASRLNVFLSLTATYSGAPNNSTAWLALGYGIYTRMTDSTDKISLLTSYSLSLLSGSVSSSTRLSLTYYSGLQNATSHTTTTYQQNNASVSTFLSQSILGYRAVGLPVGLTLTPGRYWVGLSNQSASQGNSFIMQMSFGQALFSNYIAYRPFGTSSAASNGSYYVPLIGAGSYSAQSAAWPNSIALTTADIRAATSPVVPFFNFSGYDYVTNAL